MSNTSNRKTFLLCVGAHKAGTTWLHRYLEQHSNVYMGFMKEYHVFDALTLPEGETFFNRYIEFAEERLKRIKRKLTEKPARLRSLRKNIFKMADFLADYNNYLDYFANILHTKDGIILTGDITPAYCSLSSDVLKAIRDGFFDRGVDVKALFLLRDPVERCISASQYNMGRELESQEVSKLPPMDIDKIVRKDYKKFGFEERARYDVTIGRLEEVFDEQHIHYQFYEKLFEPESIEGICDYLGIERREGDSEQRVNESKMKFVVSDTLRAELFAHYAPVYNFIYDKFSKEFVDTIWTNYNNKLAVD